MTPRLLCAAALALLLTGAAAAEEALKSGPPVGTQNNRRGFYPQFVAGQFTGQRRCPV